MAALLMVARAELVEPGSRPSEQRIERSVVSCSSLGECSAWSMLMNRMVMWLVVLP